MTTQDYLDDQLPTPRATAESIMRQVAHTPGPWHDHEHYTDNKHDGHIVVGSDGHGISRTWHDRFDNSRRSAEEVDANVRLIATAPDLLDVAQRMLRELETMHCDELDQECRIRVDVDDDAEHDNTSCPLCQLLDAAIAAIAKAIGTGWHPTGESTP